MALQRKWGAADPHRKGQPHRQGEASQHGKQDFEVPSVSTRGAEACETECFARVGKARALCSQPCLALGAMQFRLSWAINAYPMRSGRCTSTRLPKPP